MITRSAVKKSLANKCEKIKPLSSTAKNKRSAVKSKMGMLKKQNQTPKTASIKKHNSETNFDKVQSPVFNIHVHMPTAGTNILNDSAEFQPVIHLHFNELYSDIASKNLERVNKTGKVELPVKVNYISEEQNNFCESRQIKQKKKSNICKKLNFSTSKSNKNFKSEKSEVVLKSIEGVKINEEFQRNSFQKIEFPTRRSIRQAKNRKLLKALEDLSPTKIKAKKCKNIITENNSDSLGKTSNLKDSMVKLHDLMKETENVTSPNVITDSGQQTCFNYVNTNAHDIDGQEKNEKHSCYSLSESENIQNLEVKAEEIDKALEKSSDDQYIISVSKKLEDIYPLVYSSDSEGNSGTGFAENYKLFKDVREILQDVVEPKPLNVIYNSINDKIEGTNLKSNNSTKTCHNKSHSVDSDSDLSDTANFDKDNHRTGLLHALDSERTEISLNSENNNLLKNVTEENKLSSTDSDDYKEINFNTLKFQLELIGKDLRINISLKITARNLIYNLKIMQFKEMKKRNITVKKKSSRKKSLQKREAPQISEEVSEKSPAAKKIKLPKKITTNISATENKEISSSAEDYIPLKISGPTKFAVAQISKIKPYNAHKAKDFKSEMLFGKRINRYSNPKYLETYLLKRKAAAIRKK